LARLAAKLANPRIITIYSPHAISISLNPKYWYVEKLAGLLTNTVLGVSKSERDELLSYQIVPACKLRYVTTGINAASYCGSFGREKLRTQLGLSDATMLIGTAGRFTEQKDPATFLKAAAKTLERGVRAHFAWVGYGELQRPSERLARELGIEEYVSFLAYCEDLRPFLDAVDIFSLTSRFESFGYVTCEAMAMGKPVVATNVSGSKELVIPGVTGYLVNASDATAFANVYSELAAKPDLRRRMGEAGRARARKHYDLPQTIAGLEQLYRELWLGCDAALADNDPMPAATLEVSN
jgi:glycosyltransferase involved in cell wall biosynthesis